MSDLISREEALSHPFANGKYDKENANYDFILGFESYKEWLETLPIVEDRPKREWIPVSERLPEKSGEYLIAIKDRLYTQVSWFYPYDKKWSFRNADVIAWAYIPEPYKAESEDI